MERRRGESPLKGAKFETLRGAELRFLQICTVTLEL
jgi:hypothetical protein